MGFLADHLTHDDAGEGSARFVNAFNAGTGQVQLVAERLRVGRNLHVFAQPFARYFHSGTS